MATWQDKAHVLITKYSIASYRQANILPNGKRRKHHVSYSIPLIARSLVTALDHNDEHEAKRLFLIEATGAWSLT
jgi:hypothetical protein